MIANGVIVCVVGKGRNCPTEVALSAYEAGAVIAELGGIVVTGGLGGVMHAAALGAREQGGLTVGLVPAFPPVLPSDACDVVLHTGLTLAYRNALVGSVAHVGVVLPGSDGTVQEATVMHERGVPLLGYGDHTGCVTAGLPVDGWAQDPAELRALLVGLPPGDPPETRP